MAKPSDIVMMDALALSRAIHAKQVSCVEVMTAYLDHIDALNPKVNAIVSLQERGGLLRQAKERDAELARGQNHGWMHGFPQAIKDLAATKGIRTTQGSRIFKDFVPTADAIIVERVKRAGAVACALHMLPVADGSDHGGSLRNPAAYNNLFGFRPSFGRVPAQQLDGFYAVMGTPGPMARNVADLAMLLSVQAGYDPRAPLSNEQNPKQFTEPLKRDFKGVRVAWAGDFGGHIPYDPGVAELCKAALKVLESLGCIVEEAIPDHQIEAVWENWKILRAWQAGSALKAAYKDPAKRALMKPEAQFEVESGHKLAAYDVYDANAVRTTWYHAVRTFFERYDYWIMPSASVFPFDASIEWPKEVGGR